MSIQKDLEVYYKQRKLISQNPYIDIKERIIALKKLWKVLHDNESKIYCALKNDLNKAEQESYFSELALIYKEIRYYLKNIKKWTKCKKVKTSLTLFYGKSRIINEAIGQVLIISPWNYPFYLTFMPIISSIAAGNRTFVKASEHSIYSTNLIKEIINNNFDNNYLYACDESVESIISLLKNKFDLVFFTGGSKVGQKVYQECSKYNTPIILELGGKSPAIIKGHKNLDFVVNKIMFGKLVNSGQTCVAPDYVLIEEHLKNEFIKKAYKYVDNNLKSFTNYPNIINKKHLDRLKKLVPLKNQTEVLDNKIKPIIFEADWNDLIMQEEIFGPILPIIPYKNLEDVFSKINNLGKPLVVYLFTNQRQIIDNVSKMTSSGSLVVNETLTQLSNHYLPFGGVGQSGFGRVHGYQGYLAFSNQKSYYKRKFFSTKLASHPYSKKKLKWLKKLLK